MVFHWSLSNSKSPQVSRTRLRILGVLNNAVVWIVSTRQPTSKSSRPFNIPLVIVPKAPITIGTIVIFMFHSFLNSLARSRLLLLLLLLLLLSYLCLLFNILKHFFNLLHKKPCRWDKEYAGCIPCWGIRPPPQKREIWAM